MDSLNAYMAGDVSLQGKEVRFYHLSGLASGMAGIELIQLISDPISYGVLSRRLPLSETSRNVSSCNHSERYEHKEHSYTGDEQLLLLFPIIVCPHKQPEQNNKRARRKAMTYEEFKGELLRNIMQQDEVKGKNVRLLEKGFTTEDRLMRLAVKCMNMTINIRDEMVLRGDFIYLTWGGPRIVSSMQWNVREFYDKYKQEGWQGVLPQIVMKLQQTGQDNDKVFLGNSSYEQSRSRLIIRPINYDDAKYELESCIYWKYGDIALVLYGLVCDSGEDYVTMKIYRGMTEHWGMTDDYLLTNALLNTYALMPPRLYYCTDLRRRHEQEDGVFMPDEDGDMIQIHLEDELEGALGYRLTTTKGINGAIAIFYPGVQEQLSEFLGGDYYVGFTSIHEAVIHPILNQTPGSIKESIRDINAVFPMEEMLTNRVYRYCGERKQLMEI